mgnify:CR=1 FL=1
MTAGIKPSGFNKIFRSRQKRKFPFRFVFRIAQFSLNITHNTNDISSLAYSQEAQISNKNYNILKYYVFYKY